MNEQPFLHSLSVDVEDYFHVEAFADRIKPGMWPLYEWRVESNTRRVLDFLCQVQAKATFFVLGWVAEHCPGLVRQISDAGHEVACHGYLHAPIWRMDRRSFREDTRRAVKTIEDAAGCRVIGYRAPTFSITANTLWALEILAEEGFVYDSSVFPVRHDRYGIPEAPRFPFRWKLSNGGSLVELPMSTVRVLGRNLPVTGGGYLRILPMWYSRWTLSRVERHDRRAAVVYFHPWEIDAGQPRIGAGKLTSLRHYYHLERTEERLRALMAGRQFSSLSDVFRDALYDGNSPQWDASALVNAPGAMV